MGLMAFLLLGACLADEYAFWDATAAGDVDSMAKVVAAAGSLDLEYHDDDGRTPLLLAVVGSHVEAATWLVGRGVDLEAIGRWPGPEDGPLAVAAGRGDLPMMELLLASGSAAGAATGPDGRTPLIMAAARGQSEAVSVLLGVGAKVDATRADGTTAAVWAARGGHADALRPLLDHGASLDTPDYMDGSTPLHFAAQASDDGTTTRLMLEAGADVFARTAIMAPKRDPEAKEAVKATPGVTVMGGADASSPDEDEEYVPKRTDLRGGVTALMSAAAGANRGPIEAMLEHLKAKHPDLFEKYLNAVDVSGMSALSWAVHVPNKARGVECADLLIKEGARDDTLTVDGRGLIHVAASGGSARGLVWLIDQRKHRVNSRTRSEKKLTALHVAAFGGSKASVRALLRRGADVDAEGSDGATPLIAAASAAQRGVAKILLRAGANPLARLKSSGELASQTAPKTPQGKALKRSLAIEERRAWTKLEAAYRATFELEDEEDDGGVFEDLLNGPADEMDPDEEEEEERTEL